MEFQLKNLGEEGIYFFVGVEGEEICTFTDIKKKDAWLQDAVKFMNEVSYGKDRPEIKKLYFSDFAISESFIGPLTRLLRKFWNHLVEIDVKFDLKKPLKNVRGGKDLISVIQAMPNLESFNSIESKGCFDLIHFLEGFKKNSRVKEIQLVWSLVSFQQKEIDYLAEFVKENKTLRHLAVDVPLQGDETSFYSAGIAEGLDGSFLLDSYQKNETLTEFYMPHEIEMDWKLFSLIKKRNRRIQRQKDGEVDYDSDQLYTYDSENDSPKKQRLE